MVFLHTFSDVECANCQAVTKFYALWGEPCAVGSTAETGVRRWGQSDRDFRAFCVCSVCRMPCLIEVEFKGPVPETVLRRLANAVMIREGTQTKVRAVAIEASDQGHNLRALCKSLRVIPAGGPQVPGDLPPEVERIYREELLRVTQAPRQLVFTCRMLLELACRHALSVDRGNLVGLIDELATSGRLPAVVAEWAHAIRKLANDAVHDGAPPTATEAEEILEFTRLLLELLFSYPARIARLRKPKP